jgi:hypothetical protein
MAATCGSIFAGLERGPICTRDNDRFHACGVVRNVCSDLPALTTPAFKPSAAALPPKPAIACTS